MKILNFFKRNTEKNANMSVSYFLTYGDQLIFTKYDDPKLAVAGYIKNIVCYRAITLIADQVKMAQCKLFSKSSKKEITQHKLLDLLAKPYPTLNKTKFLERTITQELIYGNYYIEKMYNPRGGFYNSSAPLGLFPMRPDWMTITEGRNAIPSKYSYQPDNDKVIEFPVTMTGNSNLIHGMLFNPADDYHGLSPLVPAGYSIDIHNETNKWNYGFLKSGARPSGVLEVPKETQLNDETFKRLKQQVDDNIAGAANNGKPLLLEGGMKWIPISINPKDGDFIEMKKQATHEIALAFGLPIEMLNTEQAKYDNLNAAYNQLYHDKVIPMAQGIEDDLNAYLVPLFDKNIILKLDYSHTATMQNSRIRLMEKLNPINFMTNNEKRSKLDMEPIDGEDELQKKAASTTPEMNEYIVGQMNEGLTYNEAEAQAKLVYGN